MVTYVIIPDSDIYHSLILTDKNDWRMFDQFIGKSLSQSWIPVRVQLFKAKKSGDFPSLTSHVPVFSERALHILQPLLAGSIEALPLQCKSGNYYAINVLDVIDCLDYSQAEIERFPSGGIMYIERYAFKENSVDGKHMFKVFDAPLKQVLVSDDFKALVENNHLEGLIFKKVG